MEKILITGGAGFIGSHLVDSLIGKFDVVVLDDLSADSFHNIRNHVENGNIRFIKGTILSDDTLIESMNDVSIVFHLAAQPDVRQSVENPFSDFEVNVIGGMKLLEALRKKDIKRLIFASSGGVVYGEADKYPTPENTPLHPISNYGAAKAALEMYITSYAELYGIQSASMRLANIIGPRSVHGVIYDFFNKLTKDPTRLEVLGDGTQEKSYLYVSDVVSAIALLSSKLKEGHIQVNVGSEQKLTVKRIVELVQEEMGLMEVSIEYTGTKRGWIGDVPKVDLDISLLQSLGWKPKVELEDGVRRYVSWLKEKKYA